MIVYRDRPVDHVISINERIFQQKGVFYKSSQENTELGKIMESNVQIKGGLQSRSKEALKKKKKKSKMSRNHKIK